MNISRIYTRALKNSPQFKIILNLMLFLFIKTSLCFSAHREAVLIEVSGEVFVQERNDTVWKKAIEDMPLFEGDKIKTKKGNAEITFIEDGYVIRLEEMTSLEIKNADKDKNETGILVYTGKILSYIENILSNSFVIRTPTAILGVRSTEFGVEVNEEETEVATYSGIVSVKGITEDGKETEEILLGENLQTKIKRFHAPEMPYKMQIKWTQLKNKFPILRNRYFILRENWRKLSPQDIQRIKKRLSDFRNLSDEEKIEFLKEFREKFKKRNKTKINIDKIRKREKN